MRYEQNQTVAVKVPDDQNILTWILAKYQSYDETTRLHSVLDIEKLDSQYQLQDDSVRPFPDAGPTIKKGEALYTVWYIIEQQQWTNTLYKCVALEDYPDPEEPESVVLRVQFEEDVKPYLVNKQWVIKALD